MTSMTVVQDFLAQPKLAMVGVSRAADDFTRDVYRNLRRDHDMVPVHPTVAEIEGDPVVRRVADLPTDVGGLLVMTGPRSTDAVVEAAIDVGIGRVWLFKGAGRGSVTDQAVAMCRAHGVDVVDGQCPMMFLEPLSRECAACAVGKRTVHRYPA